MGLPSPADLAVLTAEIVASYVSSTRVPADDLPALVVSVHNALASLGQDAEPVPARQEPAVPIKKSITPDYLVSLESGLKFKSLKRYLRTRYDMSPQDYRAKWGLPADYPMVAPNYAATRSELAKRVGLGQQRKKASVVAAQSAPKRSGRKKK